MTKVDSVDKEYISKLYKDELRDGFLVTVDRKKIWNKLLELLAELDRICKKHGIKYFAEGGTLIGAARHKGFIPWDDDIDIMMLRPDYERFKQVVESELNTPFIFSTTYNSGMIYTIGKLMNKDTAAIEDYKGRHAQGIFIDIWPFDDIPDSTERSKAIWEIKQSLIASIMKPNEVLAEIEGGVQLKPSNAFVRKYIQLPVLERFREYERFCTNHFGESENVGFPFSKIMGIKGNIKRSYYDDVVYLDFESMKIPVPAEYEKVLVAEFGDWKRFMRAKSFHEVEFISADIGYQMIQENISHDLKKIENK